MKTFAVCHTHLLIIRRGAGPRRRIVRINEDMLVNAEKLCPKTKDHLHFRRHLFHQRSAGFGFPNEPRAGDAKNGFP